MPVGLFIKICLAIAAFSLLISALIHIITLDVEIDGQKFLAKAGSVVYVPANMEHSMVATPEEDVIFIAIKDLSHGIIGKATDGTMDGPRYMPGFEPK